jgi:hypothetical protein
MTINKKEERQQQQRQSLCRELSRLPGISMSEQQQPFTRMNREEKRAYLMSTLQFALDITSGDDASSFENPALVSSQTSSRWNNKDKNGDKGGQRQLQ